MTNVAQRGGKIRLGQVNGLSKEVIVYLSIITCYAPENNTGEVAMCSRWSRLAV